MRNLILSLRATALIAKEQKAREKMYKQQMKLTDFYNKHKGKPYDLEEIVKGHVLLIKDKFVG